mmetsp:Transcript_7115/g.15342  ORF Transcript_7115/g.15342 Transcript_7115/m.15342 type:complete len:163 (+) Transcript_7115:58-546(+)
MSAHFQLLHKNTSLPDVINIVCGYSIGYKRHLGQLCSCLASHGGSVRRKLAERIIFDALQLILWDNFLDVGCGTGVLVNAICQKYQQMNAVGIEIIPSCIDIARNAAFDISHNKIYAKQANLIIGDIGLTNDMSLVIDRDNDFQGNMLGGVLEAFESVLESL